MLRGFLSITLVVVYGFILLFGIFLNGSFLKVVLSSRINRHKISNLYLAVFLAVAVINCLFNTTYNIVVLAAHLPRADSLSKTKFAGYCKASIFFIYMLSVLKLLSLTLLSFDRFWALRWPYSYSRYSTKGTFHMSVCFIILQSTVTVVPAALIPGWVTYDGVVGAACSFNWSVASLYYVVLVLSLDFVLPAVLLAATNLNVFFMARKQRMKIGESRQKIMNDSNGLALVKTLVRSVELMEAEGDDSSRIPSLEAANKGCGSFFHNNSAQSFSGLEKFQEMSENGFDSYKQDASVTVTATSRGFDDGKCGDESLEYTSVNPAKDSLSTRSKSETEPVSNTTGIRKENRFSPKNSRLGDLVDGIILESLSGEEQDVGKLFETRTSPQQKPDLRRVIERDLKSDIVSKSQQYAGSEKSWGNDNGSSCSYDISDPDGKNEVESNKTVIDYTEHCVANRFQTSKDLISAGHFLGSNEANLDTSAFDKEQQLHYALKVTDSIINVNELDEFANLTKKKRLRLLSLPDVYFSKRVSQLDDAKGNTILSTWLLVLFFYLTWLPFIILRLVETFSSSIVSPNEAVKITAALNNLDVIIYPLIILYTRGNFRRELKIALRHVFYFNRSRSS